MKLPFFNRKSSSEKPSDPIFERPIEPLPGHPDWLMPVVFVGLFLVSFIALYFVARKEQPTAGFQDARRYASDEAGISDSYTSADLLDEYLRAHGGRSNVVRLHTKMVTGSVIIEGDQTPFHLQIVDNETCQFRFDRESDGSTLETYTVLGDKTWINRFDEGDLIGAESVDDAFARSLRNFSRITDPLLQYLIHKSGEILEMELDARLHGNRAIRLRMIHSDGKMTSDFYIDPDESVLLGQVDLTPEGKTARTLVFLDYRTISGVPEAEKIIVRAPGKPNTEWHFRSIVFNHLESPSVFLHSEENGDLRELSLSTFD